MENALDAYVFESNVMGTVQGMVQYNQNWKGAVRSRCVALLPPPPHLVRAQVSRVAQFCNEITAEGADPVDVLARVTVASQMRQCMDVDWDNSLDALRQAQFDGSSAMRQWFYQTCNELCVLRLAVVTCARPHLRPVATSRPPRICRSPSRRSRM